MYSVNSKYIQSLSRKDVIWSLPTEKKELFLTFDDGPMSGITEYVLDQLEIYNAKATFFCVGDNVRKHPEIFKRIASNGHTIGNHTFNHLNGWKTKIDDYVNNISMCEQLFTTKFFRPPYGRIRPMQRKKIQDKYYVILWSVLPGDFDLQISTEKCFERVIENTISGSIIVFHDSLKAENKITEVLPRMLDYYTKQGYTFSAISEELCQKAIEDQRLGRIVHMAKGLIPKLSY